LWSPAIGAEHRACRESAALFDESSFSKLDVTGRDAAVFLDHLCANAVARRVGAVTYTQLLNPRGGVECDLTVTRLAEDRFRLVTGTAFGNHDAAWIRQHLDDEMDVAVDDVTSKYACLALWGPRSREILESLTESDVSNDAFPYLSCAEINVGAVPCLAVRVTFVGELGWEFYCPSEYALGLWDELVRAGQPYGLVPGGYRAIESLRLEKGYRVWGSDVTTTDSPFEAGLGFAVKMKKEEFIGRDALAQSGPPTRRLACLVLDEPSSVVLGSEPVRSNGAPVGRVTSGGYGYTLDASIAYAYLPAELVEPGTRVSVGIFGRDVGAVVMREPLFDPKNEKVKA
jgi:4-methylaminobutanoate oxidase (formaldehyde-forming)